MSTQKTGVDVSEWNGSIHWNKVREGGASFAILRAGFGNTENQRDKQFEANIKGALEAGLAVGAYWFSYARSTDEAKREAQACLAVLEPWRSRLTLPVYFDFEYDSQAYAQQAGVTVDRRFVTDVTRAFCETIRSAGYTAGYYTNQDYYKNRLYPEELTDYELWLADYTGGPEYACSIQQCTSTGQMSGISGNVDLNLLLKDFPEKAPAPAPLTAEGICTGNGVRIRAEAHTGADILGSVNRNQRVALLADDGWGWSKVTANGVTGWMYNNYLDAPGRSSPKTVSCSGTAVNLRQSPSLSGKILRQLNPGDTRTLISINPGNWLHVEDGYLYYDKGYLRIQ